MCEIYVLHTLYVIQNIKDSFKRQFCFETAILQGCCFVIAYFYLKADSLLFYCYSNIPEIFYYWFTILFASNIFQNTLTDPRKWSLLNSQSLYRYHIEIESTSLFFFTCKGTPPFHSTGLVMIFKIHSSQTSKVKTSKVQCVWLRNFCRIICIIMLIRLISQ